MLSKILVIFFLLTSSCYALDTTWDTSNDVKIDTTDDFRLMDGRTMDTDKMVICWNDWNSGGGDAPGNCVAVTVSGTTPSLGTIAEFDNDIANTSGEEVLPYISPMSTTEFGVVYFDDDDADDGFTRVGTVTWGTPSTISYNATRNEFSTTDTEWAGSDYLDGDTYVIAYNDETDSNQLWYTICDWTAADTISCGDTEDTNNDYYPRFTEVKRTGNDSFVTCFKTEDSPDDGYCVASTWSGQTTTFGSAATFTTNNPWLLGMCVPNDDDRFVVVWEDGADTAGYAIAGTVSTTTITFGTGVDINPTSDNIRNPGCVFVSDTQFLTVFDDDANGDYPTSILCEVTWADRSISCGTGEVIDTVDGGESQYWGGRGIDILSGYGTATAKVFTTYIDDADDDEAYVIIGEVATGISEAAERRLLFIQ